MSLPTTCRRPLTASLRRRPTAPPSGCGEMRLGLPHLAGWCPSRLCRRQDRQRTPLRPVWVRFSSSAWAQVVAVGEPREAPCSSAEQAPAAVEDPGPTRGNTSPPPLLPTL